MGIDWEQELSEPQLEAVTYGPGPLRVTAGAGAGKTRVLTYRAAYLVTEGGLIPENLMLTTFTKVAAGEMQVRMADLLGSDSKRMHISTQHSWAMSFLKNFAGTGDPTLLGRADLRWNDGHGNKLYPILANEFYMGAMKDAAKEAMVNDDQLPHWRAARIISHAKNVMKSRESLHEAHNIEDRLAARVWDKYEAICMLKRCIDFDDQLVLAAQVLQEPAARMLAQSMHPWNLVDEVQDLSPVQWAIIEALSPPDSNITVVGDADQSIYGFRGAEPTKLLNFKTRYPTAKIVKLERNYRSVSTIVDHSNILIRKNSEREDRESFSEKNGETPVLRLSMSDLDEADVVVKEIEHWIESGYPHKDIAVLVRCWWQTQTFEDSFIQAGIPYRILGGLGFYDRKEINAMVRYFRLAVDPYDSEALLGDIFQQSIINVPARYLGKVAWRTLGAYAKGFNTSAYEALTTCSWPNGYMIENATELSETIEMLAAYYKGAEGIESADLMRMIEGMLQFEQYILDSLTKSEDRIDNLHALFSVAEQFPKPEDFIAHVVKLTGKAKDQHDENAVQIMTIHRAKGKEWPCVAAVGFADGVLPHFKCDSVQEERRLAYVAITRAEEQLLVTGARFYRDRPMDISPFAYELGLEVTE